MRKPNRHEVNLFETAADVLREHHEADIHQVAASVLTETGNIYSGIHLGSRRVNICAEAGAISAAEIHGGGAVIAMVAVCFNESNEPVVTNPCGVCRELMEQYAPDARVMIDDRGQAGMVPASSLLPNRWQFPFENDWTAPTPDRV